MREPGQTDGMFVLLGGRALSKMYLEGAK